jgi:hypothetical protein
VQQKQCPKRIQSGDENNRKKCQQYDGCVKFSPKGNNQERAVQ